MRGLKHASAAAIAGGLWFAGEGLEPVQAQTYSGRIPVPPALALACASGFSKANASSSAHTKRYDCVTPAIRCTLPYSASPAATARVQTSAGIRLGYRCWAPAGSQGQAACAAGFTKINGSVPTQYTCMTPIVRCPAEQGWTAQFTSPLPPVQISPVGIRLRYRCLYQLVT